MIVHQEFIRGSQQQMSDLVEIKLRYSIELLVLPFINFEHMWLIAASIRNHANSSSHCEKVHITSAVGKRHNFTHFYIYYATKN